jgi:hypothetical protein
VQFDTDADKLPIARPEQPGCRSASTPLHSGAPHCPESRSPRPVCSGHELSCTDPLTDRLPIARARRPCAARQTELAHPLAPLQTPPLCVHADSRLN